jgi:GntR family transcriptional repressor for pyruvate dehydrogenase complex
MRCDFMNPNEKRKTEIADGGLFKRLNNYKASDSIIRQVRELFISGQINPGDKLGTEKEIMNAFGVSKATLREACRVLEAMGIIEIRKGLSGGVFAAQVDMKTTINSIQGFLKFESVSIYDITMARYLLEPIIVRVVISKLSDIHIKKLKKIIQEAQTVDPKNLQVKGVSFHRYLARITENPILIIIMDFIDNLLEDMKKKAGVDNDFYDAMNDYHKNVTEYIIKGNISAAQKIIIQDILATGSCIAKAMRSNAFSPDVIKNHS